VVGEYVKRLVDSDLTLKLSYQLSSVHTARNTSTNTLRVEFEKSRLLQLSP
jgi:hypothetical protein